MRKRKKIPKYLNKKFWTYRHHLPTSLQLPPATSYVAFFFAKLNQRWCLMLSESEGTGWRRSWVWRTCEDKAWLSNSKFVRRWCDRECKTLWGKFGFVIKKYNLQVLCLFLCGLVLWRYLWWDEIFKISFTIIFFNFKDILDIFKVDLGVDLESIRLMY